MWQIDVVTDFWRKNLSPQNVAAETVENHQILYGYRVWPAGGRYFWYHMGVLGLHNLHGFEFNLQNLSGQIIFREI